MQAYKLTATVDESGQLIIEKPLNISPGKVEVIILQSEPSVETSIETQIDCSGASLCRQYGLITES